MVVPFRLVASCDSFTMNCCSSRLSASLSLERSNWGWMLSSLSILDVVSR